MSLVKKIVVVTGAGASFDLTKHLSNSPEAKWFPLGCQVPDRIIRSEAQIVQAFQQIRRPLMNCNEDSGKLQVALKTLADRLRTGVFDTLDEFVGNERDSLEGRLAAFAAAFVVTEAEYVYVHGTRSLSGWIKPVARLFAESLSLSKEPQTAVRFVTFNYDRTIEWGLARACFGRAGTPMATAISSAAKYVAHVHGTTHLDHLAVQNGHAFSPEIAGLEGSADSIRLVCAKSGNCNRVSDVEEVERAKSWLAEADIVAFLGFGFAPSCLSTLSMGNGKAIWTENTMVLTTSYESNDWLRRIGDSLGCRVALADNSTQPNGMLVSTCDEVAATALRMAQQR